MVRELYVSQIHIKAAARALMTAGEAADLEATMDHMIRMAFPNLIQLRELDVDTGTAPQMNIILTSHLSLAPSSITKLDLNFNDYSLVSSIIPLFPQLDHLTLTLPEVLPPWIATASPASVSRPPDSYPICSLEINANFNSLSILNLVAFMDPFNVNLMGLSVENGLDLLDAELGSMNRLSVRPEYKQGVEYPFLDTRITVFKKLQYLCLGEGYHYLRHDFFTTYFTPSSPLVVLIFEPFSGLNADDFITAFPKRPASLKQIILDMTEDYVDMTLTTALALRWDRDCRKNQVRRIIKLCRKAGISVEGHAVEALKLIDEARTAARTAARA
jgi:hypothetical protein